MKVSITRRAVKQLASLTKTSQIIVDKRIKTLGFVGSYSEEKLSGYKNYFRTRVGDFRIVYKKNSVEICVVLIGHRREIYKLLKDLLG